MKDVSSFKRPQCVVQIVWVIGVRLDLYILDCDQAHDSSAIVQCVSTTLEHIAKDFESQNRQMPSALFLWVPGLACAKTPSHTSCLSRIIYSKVPRGGRLVYSQAPS
jgi:hypothetical protein